MMGLRKITGWPGHPGLFFDYRVLFKSIFELVLLVRAAELVHHQGAFSEGG